MKILLTLFITILCLNCFAQNENNDVVYLKNGSIIKGAIIEYEPYKTVKIQTSDGSIFVYKTEECESIIKNAPKVIENKIDKPKIENIPSKYSQNCYFASILDFNFYLGRSEFEKYYYTKNTKNTFIMGLHTINGVQFLKNFFVGIGIGFNYHPVDTIISTTTGYHISIPLYLDTRWYITNKSTQPFINISGGLIFPYSYIANKTDNYGNKDIYYYFFNPSIGIKTIMSSGSSFNLVRISK